MRRYLLLLLLAILTCSTAFAGPVAWALRDVTFTDGGAATGYLVFDGGSLVTYRVSVSGGNTFLFPAFL